LKLKTFPASHPANLHQLSANFLFHRSSLFSSTISYLKQHKSFKRKLNKKIILEKTFLIIIESRRRSRNEQEKNYFMHQRSINEIHFAKFTENVFDVF
jgi:hypothetical protein